MFSRGLLLISEVTFDSIELQPAWLVQPVAQSTVKSQSMGGREVALLWYLSGRTRTRAMTMKGEYRSARNDPDHCFGTIYKR